jgi:hypothetical protein
MISDQDGLDEQARQQEVHDALVARMGKTAAEAVRSAAEMLALLEVLVPPPQYFVAGGPPEICLQGKRKLREGTLGMGLSLFLLARGHSPGGDFPKDEADLFERELHLQISTIHDGMKNLVRKAQP